MESLRTAIDAAQKADHAENGKCAMCTIGDEPTGGLHRGQHRCGNNDTCTLCHNAGMEYGDQCAACGRIEKNMW